MERHFPIREACGRYPGSSPFGRAPILGTKNPFQVFAFADGTILIQREENRPAFVVEEISPRRSDPTLSFDESPLAEQNGELYARTRPKPQTIGVLRFEDCMTVLLVIERRPTKQARDLFDGHSDPERAQLLTRDPFWRSFSTSHPRGGRHQEEDKGPFACTKPCLTMLGSTMVHRQARVHPHLCSHRASKRRLQLQGILVILVNCGFGRANYQRAAPPTLAGLFRRHRVTVSGRRV